MPPCSWYPLIDVNGIHLPAAFAELPHAEHDHQPAGLHGEEMRWQSNDDSSHWRWTVGVFGELSKEGSIEELKTPTSTRSCGTFGVPATATVRQRSIHCPTTAAYPLIPACDIYYNDNTMLRPAVRGFRRTHLRLHRPIEADARRACRAHCFRSITMPMAYENYGPSPANAKQSETPNTPKASIAFQMDPATCTT